MQKFSLHTHTLGFDGRNTEEEMLQQAKALGWKKIGFSNHFIVHPRVKEAPMYAYALKGGYSNIYAATFDEAIERFQAHYKKIDELRERTGIKILKGMEVDFFSNFEWREGFEEALQILKPDYLIGSAHFVEHNGILCNSHDIQKAPPLMQKWLLHRYWQNERLAVQSGWFDIIAHLDLMKKVGLGHEEEWVEEEYKTVAAIQKSGSAVELNTSYFKFGDEPYPSRRIMKMLSGAKVPVLLSDDAHAAAQLGNHFAQTEEMAHDFGLAMLTGKSRGLDTILAAHGRHKNEY